MRAQNNCSLSSCVFDYDFDIIRSPEDALKQEKSSEAGEGGASEEPKVSELVSEANQKKLDHFKATLKAHQKKKADEARQAEKTAQKEGTKKAGDKVEKPQRQSREFEALKTDFEKSIFENFAQRIRRENLVFGFQVDSRTRVDYGGLTRARAELGTCL